MCVDSLLNLKTLVTIEQRSQLEFIEHSSLIENSLCYWDPDRKIQAKNRPLTITGAIIRSYTIMLIIYHHRVVY